MDKIKLMTLKHRLLTYLLFTVIGYAFHRYLPFEPFELKWILTGWALIIAVIELGTWYSIKKRKKKN